MVSLRSDFLLKRFKLGMNPNMVCFDDFRIWLSFQGLPYMRRTEEDIRCTLHDFIPVNSIKPHRHQVVPTASYRVQTTPATSRRVPTGINIEEEEDEYMVSFRFEKLPFYFCFRCRKLGHGEDTCEDLLRDDDVPPAPNSIAAPALLDSTAGAPPS